MIPQAMILAAGRGERMMPITDRVPKPLLPFFGHPLLFYALQRCREAGINKVVINLHHLAAETERAIPSLVKQTGVEVILSVEETIRGTAGGIRQAVENHLIDPARPLMVMNSDIMTDLDLKSVLDRYRRSGAAAVTVLSPAWGLSPTEVGIGREDLVVRFPGLSRDLSPCLVDNLVFIGCQILSPEALSFLPSSGYSSLAADFYLPILKEGKPIEGFFHEGYWRDLGTPIDFLRSHVDFLDRVFDPGGIKPSEVDQAVNSKIISPSYLGQGVEIGAGSVIGPYTILGPGCRLGKRCRISQSVLFPGTALGADTRIDRALVMDDQVVAVD